MMVTMICSDKLGTIRGNQGARHTYFAVCNSEELIRRTIFYIYVQKNGYKFACLVETSCMQMSE